MAKSARDVMTTDTTCIGEDDSVLDAARLIASLDVGALPICGKDDRLKGMLTDRDIVVKVLAAGKDPGTTRAGEVGEGDGTVVPEVVGEIDGGGAASAQEGQVAVRPPLESIPVGEGGGETFVRREHG